MADIQAIVDQIKEMTLLEASQLVKLMEETFGVSAAAAVAAAPAAAAAGGGEAAAPAEEPPLEDPRERARAQLLERETARG